GLDRLCVNLRALAVQQDVCPVWPLMPARACRCFCVAFLRFPLASRCQLLQVALPVPLEARPSEHSPHVSQHLHLGVFGLLPPQREFAWPVMAAVTPPSRRPSTAPPSR